MGRHPPVVDGACPTVTVKTSSAATEKAGLAKPDTTLPDVWLPDSSLWVQQLRTDIAGQDTAAQSMWMYPAIASSPLVLATNTANQAAAATLGQSGWVAALASPTVSIIDPTTSTDGLLRDTDGPVVVVGPGGAGRHADHASLARAGSTSTRWSGCRTPRLSDTNAAFLALTQPAGAKLMRSPRASRTS